MKILTRQFTITLSLAFLIISATLLSSTLKAQAYRGLILDETIMFIENVEQGNSVEKTFTVTHDFQDRQSVNLQLEAINFISDGKTGTPTFLIPNNLPENANLADWITFENPTVSLDSYGAVATVNFTIDIPIDAEPGGYYASVFPLDLGGKDSLEVDDISKVGINGAPGVLIFLTVGGERNINVVTEDLILTDINGKEKSFFFNPPVNITPVLKNNGNVHVNPRGVVFVYKGNNYQNYEGEFEMNPTGGYILPSSTREFTVTWDESFIKTIEETIDGEVSYKTEYDWDNLSELRVGKYNVKVLYSYTGVDGQIYNGESTGSFWMIPWQLILAVIVLIIFILLFIALKIRSRRKYRLIR